MGKARAPEPVDHRDPAALLGWLAQVSTVREELHELALESTARKRDRRHAKHWLRGCTLRRLRELDALLTAITPVTPLEQK